MTCFSISASCGDGGEADGFYFCDASVLEATICEGHPLLTADEIICAIPDFNLSVTLLNKDQNVKYGIFRLCALDYDNCSQYFSCSFDCD